MPGGNKENQSDRVMVSKCKQNAIQDVRIINRYLVTAIVK